MGIDERARFWFPVDDEMDGGNQKRTSQRAELLAAIKGLDIISERAFANETPAIIPEGLDKSGNEWVIVTDSMYLVQGVTE